MITDTTECRCSTCSFCNLNINYTKEEVTRKCKLTGISVEMYDSCEEYRHKNVSLDSSQICNAHYYAENELYCDNLDC